MAEETSKVSTKKASEKLRSPNDLNEFLRVTHPSVWVLLAACAITLIGLFAWGVFGTVTTSVSATGTCVKGEVVCFLSADDASKVRVGYAANVGGEPMEVATLSAAPVSRVEAREIVGSDYLTSTLVEEDWVYVVHFKGDGDRAFTDGIPIPVTITTERIAPISLIFGNAA